MQKFIISGFTDEIADDLDQQISGMKRLGMEYMELRSIDGEFSTYFSAEKAKAVKKKLDTAGIHVSSLGSRIGKWPISDPFAPQLEEFRHALEVAHILNAPYIRIFSFFTDQVENPYDYTDEVLKRLSVFKDEAKGSGVVLLHENEKLIYGDVPERCKIIAEELYSPEFQLIFDPSNYVECGVETYPHAYQMLKPYIAYMHIKDCRQSDKIVVPVGMGDGHVKEILSDLKKSGYSGFLSLEPHLADYAGLAYDKNGTPKAGEPEFALSHKALMNLLESI